MRSDAPQADNLFRKPQDWHGREYSNPTSLMRQPVNWKHSDEMSWRLKSWKKRFKTSMVPSFMNFFVSVLGFCSLAVCFSLVYSVLPLVGTRSFVLSIVIEELYSASATASSQVSSSTFACHACPICPRLGWSCCWPSGFRTRQKAELCWNSYVQ